MAIVVEEKRGSGGILSFLIWLVVLALVLAGAYYLFFKKQDLIPVPPPANFEQAMQISQLEIDPQAVLSGAKFKSLQNFVTPSEARQVGRSNPFLP